MKKFGNINSLIIDPEHLFIAWEIFKRDKRNKPDVAKFERNLESHIFELARDLADKTYKHGRYKGFWIRDPKLRRIHKATVRDRILHHAVFKVLNVLYDPTFIPTSFSCRIGKGTHKGVRYLHETIRKASRNYTRACFVLKCDIKKFFDSIDHEILLGILRRKITDPDTRWLLNEIVSGFSSVYERERERVKALRAEEYRLAT